MKANSTRTFFTRCGLLFVIVLITTTARSQAPIYSFKNPTLISGTAGQVNAVYRLPDVNPSGASTDALVKIQSRVGSITLQNIDRTADGYPEAFQPEYRVGANNNSYFEFLITFVQGGTSTPASQPTIEVSGLDIDGSTNSGGFTVKEFNRVDMGGGICTFNLLGSQLTLAQIGTAYEGANFTGFLFGTLVDTAAKEVMFSVSNVNVTSFTYRVGSNNQTNNNSSRYASLYFKKFTYPNPVVLSVKNLASFSGVLDGEKAKLKWTLTEDNIAGSVILEKSNSGSDFQPVAELWVNIDGNTQKDFSYTDAKGASAAVYYRLKITGRDGKTEYSNILAFRTRETMAHALSVYPSLVQSAATVSYPADEKENAVIMVTDMSGRMVKQHNIVLQKGINNIQLTGFDTMGKGNYIVSVYTAQQRSARQIIVQ